MKTSLPFVLAAALAASMPVHASHESAPATAAAEAAVPAKLAATRAALRDLWIGHVFWVRAVVDARFEGDAVAATAAEKQVVANAKAIAGAIEPFYGKAASDKLFGQLAGHWGAINDYLTATRAAGKADQDAAFQRLVTNAGEIATFLSGANPYLPNETLRGLLTAHGAHHVQQIQQFAARQFDAEAQTWSAMTGHMYVIADALADALAKQFPDKFR
ncbi:MAG: hypothetical protein ACT4UP_05980 [Gammaproteobacteria bacterium]